MEEVINEVYKQCFECKIWYKTDFLTRCGKTGNYICKNCSGEKPEGDTCEGCGKKTEHYYFDYSCQKFYCSECLEKCELCFDLFCTDCLQKFPIGNVCKPCLKKLFTTNPGKEK